MRSGRTSPGAPPAGPPPSAADEALRFQAALLDAVGEAVLATDTDGTTIYWNRAAEAMYGWSAAEVIGRQTLDTLSHQPGGPLVDEIVRHLLDGRTWSGVAPGRRRDGSAFPSQVTATPMLDAAGELVAVISVVRDITRHQQAEDRMRELSAIVESSGCAIIGNDLDGRVRTWNAAAEALYGYTADQAIGRSSEELVVPPERRGEIVQLLSVVRAGQPVRELETVHQRRDSTRVDIAVTFSPIHDAGGTLVGVSAIARDITARKRLERALAEDRGRLAEAQRVARLGSFEYDPSNDNLTWSDELYRIFGLEPGRPVGPDDYVAGAHPGDVDLVRAAVDRRSHPTTLDHVHRVLRPDGTLRWVHVRASVDEQDPARRMLGTVLDITERKLAEEALEHRARHDALTDLPNRVLLADRLTSMLAEPHARGIAAAVIFLDVDQFKVINDSLGHAAGDQLLVLLAERLRRGLRPTDTVARFGGDEFVVLCEALNRGEAAALAQRLCESLAEPVLVDGAELVVTVSAGLAMASPGQTAESLLRDADAAMYRAKERGRGRVEIFGQHLRRRAQARLDTETDLRRAVSRRELQLAYQPVLSLRSGRVVGVEALMRWDHAERGPLAPDQFVPVAEESGLIVPIGAWALHEALAQLGHWRRQLPGGRGLHVSVNLSGRQLAEPGLHDLVANAAALASVPLSALHLEITESVLMDDTGVAEATLAALDELGVRLDVDDFGTGYASLSYLKRFPIDGVKIDRSFLDGLGSDNHDTSIVAAVSGLASALGLTAVAEGVETLAQVAVLRELGCGFGQGHLWAPALHPVEFAAWFTSHGGGRPGRDVALAAGG
ncbi:MAG: EAL domain-containing protein [Acidimicrobiia bacterium]|nr:EAL domain-containing protein [Acidimicrobiia bacterium]